jgi:hypothetical protein
LLLGLALAKFYHERVRVGKLFRFKEVQQREQLFDIVLQRRAGEQYTVVL